MDSGFFICADGHKCTHLCTESAQTLVCDTGSELDMNLDNFVQIFGIKKAPESSGAFNRFRMINVD
jgi:hypothetical protein